MRDTRQETSTTFKTTMIPFKRLASFAAFCMVLTCPGRVAALGIAPSLSSLRSTLPSERRQRHPTLLALVTTDSHGSATSSTTTASSRACPHLIYTHLEVNGMLWQIPAAQNLSLLIDPIAGQLDFGIAPLYTARKKYLTEQSQFYNLIAQAAPTHVLLTQGLDDHTHLPTLRELVKRHVHLHFIIPASVWLNHFDLTISSLVADDDDQAAFGANNADANGESMMLFNMIQANHKRVQSTNEERDEAKFQKKQQQDNKMHELLVRKLTKQNGHLEKHDHHLEKHGSCLVHLQSPHHAQMKSTLKARKEKKKCYVGQRML